MAVNYRLLSCSCGDCPGDMSFLCMYVIVWCGHPKLCVVAVAQMGSWRKVLPLFSLHITTKLVIRVYMSFSAIYYRSLYMYISVVWGSYMWMRCELYNVILFSFLLTYSQRRKYSRSLHYTIIPPLTYKGASHSYLTRCTYISLWVSYHVWQLVFMAHFKGMRLWVLRASCH